MVNLASHKHIEPIRHRPTATTQDQLLFGRKSNTERSVAFNNITTHDTLAHRLEKNLLTTAQIASQYYSRDRVKVVPRGSSSPHESPTFDPMFSVGSKVSESELYRALEDLAKAANAWAQQKRNLPLEKGRLIMRELVTRHSGLANSHKAGLTRNTFRFYYQASDLAFPALSHNQRLSVMQNQGRDSKTSKLKKLFSIILIMLEYSEKL